MRWGLALLTIVACQGTPSSEPASPAPPSFPAPPGPLPAPPGPAPAPAPSPPPSLDEPVRCAGDHDCPGLACGPCRSGDTVMQSSAAVACYRNPCPGTTAVCRNGVCVVR